VELFQVKKESEEESFEQFLTFMLDKQEFGVQLRRVQEIRGYTPIMPLPHVPPHIIGVINLRGTVVPVVDLRIKFGKPPVEYTKFTVIVIAKVGAKGMGLIVDSVSDVLSVLPDAVEAAPDFGSAPDARSVDRKVIKGIIKTGDRMAVLLDLDNLTASDQAASAAELATLSELDGAEAAAGLQPVGAN
jgi:purine-binding chemotaxis protein CheW